MAAGRVHGERPSSHPATAQELRHQNPGGEFQVKCRAPVIAALFEETVDVQVEERGESPDLVGIRRQIAQQPAEHADRRQQRHGHLFAARRTAWRAARSARPSQAGDVSAQDAGDQAAFQAQIGRRIAPC
jgi:hypothetical protein